MSRILIVEDDPEMAEILDRVLSEQGYLCRVASNGTEGIRCSAEADLLLVDVMMPKMNGFTMVETLRGQGFRNPIIYVTARDRIEDLVQGLETGADDYLVKPFKLAELLARVKAALRRSRDSSLALHWGDLALDCLKRTAFLGDSEIYLSSTEFALLELFMRNPDVVLSKSLILGEVWHDEGYRDENIVETYIVYLRRKIETHGASRVIHTMRGRGYRLGRSEMES